MGRLDGKVALITGGARGMGKAHVRHFAAEGAQVVFGDVLDDRGAAVAAGLGEQSCRYLHHDVTREEDWAAAVALTVETFGKLDVLDDWGETVAAKLGEQACRYTHHDVTSEEDWAAAVALTVEVFGRLDVLVNNAGVYRFWPIESITEEDFHRHYDINVLGPILAVREALKHFGPEGGSVINISSVVGAAPWPQTALYSSTKAAVDNLTHGLALELAPRKVRVNAVAPGTTESEGTSDLHLFEGDEGKKVIASTPLGRLGTPADIARVVVFLASDESAWVTGEVIRASGGLR